MKRWLILKLAGPAGVLIKPVLASLVGTVIAVIYQHTWHFVYQFEFLRGFADSFIANIDPSALPFLTPKAIGVAVAACTWSALSDWIITHMKAGGKELQTSLKDSPRADSVKIDGIVLRGGPTVQSVRKLGNPTRRR
jgi:hypothetical protein